MELEYLEQFIWKMAMKYCLEKTTVITGESLIVIVLLNFVWQSFAVRHRADQWLAKTTEWL